MSEPWHRDFPNGVRVRVFPDERYLETIFADDSRVPAAPQDNDEYRARAQALGYGDDVWRMCQEHEIAHTELMQRLGLEYSPTLWAVAHGDTRKTREMGAEEELVLAFQRWRLVRR